MKDVCYQSVSTLNSTETCCFDRLNMNNVDERCQTLAVVVPQHVTVNVSKEGGVTIIQRKLLCFDGTRKDVACGWMP